MATEYPVRFQADNYNAKDAKCTVLCHVFDKLSEVAVALALSKTFSHVVALDAGGEEVYHYDNR